jgi:hypothetical protein
LSQRVSLMGRAQRLVRLLFAITFACGEVDRAPGAPGGGSVSAAGSPAICDEAKCRELAGPCQQATCEARTGACQRVAAPEEQPCLEGNACGRAVCRAGECVPLDPPSCAAVAPDECAAQVCRPARGGCVVEPLDVPGTRCELALPLEGGTPSVNASSRCGDHARSLPGCTAELLGRSVHVALDLRAAEGATPVTLVIDAEFAFEAALARGPCEDGVLERCATPLYTDGHSRAIVASLLPDRYELTVTGRGADDTGTVHVAMTLGEPSCERPPLHDECEAALPLDGSLAVQSVIGDVGCGNASVPVRCTGGDAPDVFYDLDLSSRTSDVLVDVDVDALDDGEVTAALFPAQAFGCGELSMCGAAFGSRLEPGRYRIGVARQRDYAGQSLTASPIPFALRVRAQAADCMETRNDTWQNAIELDPSVEKQRLAGNTACASNDIAAGCNEDRGAPDVFYRLDLRGYTSARGVRLDGPAATDLAVYVLSTDEQGAPLAPAGCYALSPWATFVLAPRLYYLVIDGRVTNAGRFDVELQQREAYPVPVACIAGFPSPDNCARDSEPGCADSPANPECLRTAVECGLDANIYVEFCTAFAGCCDGTAERDACLDAWSSKLECL